ncbi:uncharacterized protein [Panulirus ornatus]|uniref:uncharacterized protein isoform X2 n=1 Tax=Panulirus ornatus TaxID=150431 RepID=UPI003A84C97C
MVSRVQQSSGSFTWFLVVLVSLVLVVRVQPYPGYGERIRSGGSYEPQKQASGDITPTDDYLDDHLDYSHLYDYDPYPHRRKPEFNHFDKPQDSTKNLQQIMRLFPPVIGGTSPSDRVILWRDLDDPTANGFRGGKDEAGGLSSPGAHLTQLSFSEPKQKRETIWPCVYLTKLCPLG